MINFMRLPTLTLTIKQCYILFGSLAVLFFCGLLLPAVAAFRINKARMEVVQACRTVSLERLFSAREAFLQNQRVHGRPDGTSVTLEELVAGGFLKADEVRGVNGIEAIVPLNDERSPGEVLRAGTPWEWISFSTNGYIQRVSKRK